MRSAALLAALAASAGAAQPPQDQPLDADDIVVTGRPGSRSPQPDAVEVLRTYCFDPARRSGRPAPPGENSRWYPLEDEARRQFRIVDPRVQAFSRADGARGHELWLKIEERALPNQLVEQSCTLLVVGGRDHERFVGDMAKLFRGVPTQNHVGHSAGTAGAREWRQWLWTGNPQRGSRAWRSMDQPKSGRTSWMTVVDPSFFLTSDYIVGEVRLRSGAKPLALLTFAVTRSRSR